MTVGGSTSGSATTASTRNFQRRRENAIQYAMGSPIATSAADTSSASFTVRKIAVQFMSSFRGRRRFHAVPRQQLHDLRPAQERQKRGCRRLVRGMRDD